MAIQLSDHFTYKKLLRFTFPSIIMLVFTSIYGVVDGLFVSNFVGKTPFAAINLVMPFLMVMGGFGFMIGTGGSALVAKTLGMGEKDKANKYFSMMIIITAILGVILTVVGIIFMRPISYFLGATSDMIEDCVTYGRIILIFNTAFMLQNVFQSFFVAAEKPKLGLYVTVAAGLTNMLLDALLVGLFDFGIEGAAYATGISQCVGGILPVFYFARKNSSLLRFELTKLQARPIFLASVNGSSELMTNISSSVVGMLYNFQLLKLTGENGVAAYGVLMYVNFIFIAIFIGYAVGSAPIIGYHYGAENHAELKGLLKKSLLVTLVMGVGMFLLAKVLAYPLAKIFVGYDTALFEMTKRGFELFSFSFLVCGFNIFGSSFFTALNNGGVSAAISFMRTLVFQMTSVIFLPMVLELDGIWLAGVAAEILALFVTTFFLALKRKKYNY